VLNYIQGRSLQKYIEANGPASEGEVIMLALKVCDILEYLHGREPPIVHRDLTPDNLMVDKSGQVYLIDFNVARELDSNSSALTVAGKNSYIPPEQFRGSPSTQSDIYAFGATLFWMLTGHEPEPLSVSRPRSISPVVSVGMDETIATATQQELEQRYKSVAEMKSTLMQLAAVIEHDSSI
jgi:serine/threonine protein kinase